MREILFKAKRIDNGEWVEGFYNGCYSTPTIDYLKDGRVYNVMIKPETRCEYTGLTDKNGVKIFEGDIFVGLGNIKYQIVFDSNAARYMAMVIEAPRGQYSVGDKFMMCASSMSETEIIGNIHDKGDETE